MRIVKYGSVGLINTIISYLIFYTLVSLGIHYLLASTVSFILGTVFSYIMNSNYTFSMYKSFRKFTKFFIITLISLSCSLILLYFLKNLVGFDVLLAQVIVVIVRFPIVYLLMKRIVFSRAQQIIR
ncbi:GtrA family protein [Vibrio atypicus]|uniref:GtrA family protein n=1 Tax=Vibrio atypicus TaxID=558271 RepID=UPI00135B4021|nr:GtrA family protein [Vibrio atypicus]